MFFMSNPAGEGTEELALQAPKVEQALPWLSPEAPEQPLWYFC